MNHEYFFLYLKIVLEKIEILRGNGKKRKTKPKYAHVLRGYGLNREFKKMVHIFALFLLLHEWLGGIEGLRTKASTEYRIQ